MKLSPVTGLALGLGLAFALSGRVCAEDYLLTTSYENWWFTNGPPRGGVTNYFWTNASTVAYGGHVLGNSNAVSPSDGHKFQLAASAFGQPVKAVQSDVVLGSIVSAPEGANTNVAPANFIPVTVGNNAEAYWEEPSGGAFWSPSTGQVIASQPNNVIIEWRMQNGTTNRQMINVGAVPDKRPARLFWTEDPYLAPVVDMDGLFPAIHYNAQVPRPVEQYTTNSSTGTIETNILAGVWLDSAKQLRAKNITGTFLIEYYQEGTYKRQVQPNAIEVVQVLPPEVQLVSIDVGSRLMPVDTYWAELDSINGVIPNVTRGRDDTVYVHGQKGPKYNWAFAIKRTGYEPWSAEVYWQHRGIMDVQWPYEVDWYSCDWPAYPQLFVLGDSSTDQAPALIPSELGAEIMSDMDPPYHATISGTGRSFTTTKPGTCLVKYSTYNDVWFDVVKTVSHTDQTFFDLEPREWPIGEELTPGDDKGYAMGFDGTADFASIGDSWLNQETNWTISLWFKVGDFRACTLYSEGNPGATFDLGITTNKQIQITTWSNTTSKTVTSTSIPLQTNHWHYLAVTYSSVGDTTNSTVQVYLDDYHWQTSGLPRVNFSGAEFAAIGARTASPQPNSGFFYGKIDQLRIWNMTLSADQVRRSLYETPSETSGHLVADFPFDEGQGQVILNAAGGNDASAGAGAFWCYGQVISKGGVWEGFPGYIHTSYGNRYNVNRYNYPTESTIGVSSYVFGVNEGELEVWWAHRSRQEGMPPVYYPSQVVRYTNEWPSNPLQIVIASERGNTGDSIVDAANALQFNGTSSYVRVPNNALFDLKNQFTVEAWINLSATNGTREVVSWAYPWSGGASGFRLCVYEGAVYAVDYYNLNYSYAVSGGSVSTNAWTHIAMVLGSGRLKIYLNGQLVGDRSAGNEMGPYNGDLYMGRLSASSANYLSGSIGEVRIWSIARTAEELQNTLQTTLTGDEPGLLAYYPFVRGDDSSVLTDAGPNKLHGTVSGATWTTAGRPTRVPGPLVFGSPSIYYQNDRNLPGYNPNEEHALVLGGTVYALRDDLNTTNTSKPFVLVDYLDPATGHPRMMDLYVLRTNELYSFHKYVDAGLPIIPPEPLGGMPLCKKNDSTTQPPAWHDRKSEWWAAAAGVNGGTADAHMLFYYQVQPGFWWPEAETQPIVGSEVPWLPSPSKAGGTEGTPITVVYTVSWPEVPKLKLGQTLTRATAGLPEVWSQLSAEVVYDQRDEQGKDTSVELFDPVQAHGRPLASSVVDAMITAKLARRDTTGNLVRFPNLPPSLYKRLYYNPDYYDPVSGIKGQLVLVGQYIEPLTGDPYLLLNMLEPFERTVVSAAATGIDNSLKSQWDTAVSGLPSEITRIGKNDVFVNAALGAKLTNGPSYVTLAFNNGTNVNAVPPATPIQVEVIQVDTNLYSGYLQVIQPEDVLAEQLSLRYGADLGGHVSECQFRWRWTEPVGGLEPEGDYEDSPPWYMYAETDKALGTNEVSISGASQFTLSDHYFAVSYRPKDSIGPSGTNWSEWSSSLAPGWVKRAMNGVNPFMQMLSDMTENAVDTRVTMVSQAGEPYQGDIALNMEAVSKAGLIPAYETIFNRAKDFSLRAGSSTDSMNETLLYAASRLRDLYMLLGNEAYADAMDPTIAFPQSLSTDTSGAFATSIFPFMNQEPNLLEEELALLRGRDNTLSPFVDTPPIYNRLIWNFTAGINGGEAAYAYNYDIRGNPTNTQGTITVDDAKKLYPQGHGDAWGHYLSAINHYYDLLSYDIFHWHTEPSATLLGESATVSVDFFDEQKFAETAAARARTGLAILQRTFRQRYSEDSSGLWSGYTDSDTNRAWGIGEWASRAGQAAYYDWVVANSLMYDSLTNMSQVGGSDVAPEGIQKIDRDSTPELREIAATMKDIQNEVDSANAGLNPLGLARGVVPFDIDPTGIDAGKTHFEQIYDRAVQAVYNSCVAFDQARLTTLQLRKGFESVADMAAALAKAETDYRNQLIEIYGYPYADDIGPTGTYPQGYDGPDLINWQMMDLKNLVTNAPLGQTMTNQLYTIGWNPQTDWKGNDPSYYSNLTNATPTSNYVGEVVVSMTENGIKVKPSTWGTRRAEGELQLALTDYVQQWYTLEAKMAEYAQNIYAIEVDINHRQADYTKLMNEWDERQTYLDNKQTITTTMESLKITKELIIAAMEVNKGIVSHTARSTTQTAGGAGWASSPVALVTVNPAVIASTPAVMLAWAQWFAGHAMSISISGAAIAQADYDHDWESLVADNSYKGQMRWPTMDTLVKLQNQEVMQSALLAQVEALSATEQRIAKLVAEGERIVFERAQSRARAAQRIQLARYGDLAFRVYRDDALRRYQSTFDLASRYTYLAAKAYDYETGLLESDTSKTPGAKFLEDVVRARAPGRFYAWLGTPMTGGSSGEPGLSDVLARMKGDWDVVKGRFGFNNPETETSRFSLRTELYRTSPDGNGNGTWATTLDSYKVANLHDYPEFIRYCRPFSDTTNIEPALVIPFSTCVLAGRNYFGHDLAGGDNAYDSSHAATKIRSVGVWFTGYNNTFTTNSAAGLANEPRVYLVPIGEDIMRSPTRNAMQYRHWKVIDQAIPLPYDIGGADIDNPDWMPVINSLREPLAQVRRFASFRAYHDKGEFDPSETISNGRLVGRSVWNTSWVLIIPGRTLLSDPVEGLERFIHGSVNTSGNRDGEGVTDIKIFFQTYSIPGD